MSCKSDKWLTFLGAAEYGSWRSASSQIVNCWARGRPNKILIKHHQKKKFSLVNLIPSSPSLPLHLLDIPGLMAAPIPARTPPKNIMYLEATIQEKKQKKTEKLITSALSYTSKNQARLEHSGGVRGGIPCQHVLRWWMIRGLVLTKGEVLSERGPGRVAEPDPLLSTGFGALITPIGKPVVDAVPRWPYGHCRHLPTPGPPPTESTYFAMASPPPDGSHQAITLPVEGKGESQFVLDESRVVSTPMSSTARVFL